MQFAIGGNISGFNSHTLGNGDGYNTCWVAGAVVGGNGDGGVLTKLGNGLCYGVFE